MKLLWAQLLFLVFAISCNSSNSSGQKTTTASTGVTVPTDSHISTPPAAGSSALLLAPLTDVQNRLVHFPGPNSCNFQHRLMQFPQAIQVLNTSYCGQTQVSCGEKTLSSETIDSVAIYMDSVSRNKVVALINSRNGSIVKSFIELCAPPQISPSITALTQIIDHTVTTQGSRATYAQLSLSGIQNFHYFPSIAVGFTFATAIGALPYQLPIVSWSK